MNPVSAKRKRSKLGTKRDPVYQAVDQRSRGRCERPGCSRRAKDHHHCLKPRASYHAPEYIVALCRACHERCDYPYLHGRLLVVPENGGFRFSVIVAPDKFAARARGA